MTEKELPAQNRSRYVLFSAGVLVFAIVLIIGLGSSGCGARRKSGASGSSDGVKRELEKNANFVQSALGYTLSIQRYEEKGFKESMVDDLNSWARSLSPQGEWQVDPMIKTLPEIYQDIPATAGIEKLTFKQNDVDFIQEAIWAKAVADRATLGPSRGAFQYLVGAACHELPTEKNVAIRSSNDPLFDSLRELHPKLDDEQVENLNRALLIFDWVVRNIQLDEMVVELKGDAELQRAKDFVDVPTGDAATDGVDGPGYTRSPGEVLLYGKGDTWHKSRLFILLCRQLGIDSIMLNVIDRNDKSKVVPWVVGVMIADRLFLFDMEMGIPFPSKDYRKVATLSEILKDRSALTQLKYKLSESTDADSDYRIQPGQLDKLVVWMEVAPEAMTRRMNLLQPKLTGDYKASISYSPSALKDKLKKWNFERIEISPHPFQHSLFKRAYVAAVDRQKQKGVIRNYVEQEYFRIKLPIKKMVRKEQIDEQSQSVKSGSQVETPTVRIYLLSEARHRFLLGVFESDLKNEKNSLGARKLKEDLELGRDTEDAAQMFVNLMLDDNRIDEIMSDDTWLQMMDMAADSNVTLSDQQLEHNKSIYEASMRLCRTDSSIWLAHTNFETGDFGNAQNWLSQIQRFDPNKKWGPLTQYNLARTHEALLDFKESIRILRSENSMQKFGNIIRARLIQRWNLGDKDATKPE